jgi:hypothetical protein
MLRDVDDPPQITCLGILDSSSALLFCSSRGSTQSTFVAFTITYSPSLLAQVRDKATITEAYVKGLKAVFASFAVLVAVHLCACACIWDYGLEQGQKTKQRRITSD